MTTFVIDAVDQTQQTLSNNQYGIVTQNGTLAVSGDAILVTGIGVDIDNQGTIFSTLNAIDITGATTTIQNSGSISSRNTVIINSNLTAASDARIINSGTISATSFGVVGSDAINLSAGGNTIINSGTITSYSGTGIHIFSLFESGFHPNSIYNSGLISAVGDGSVSNYWAILTGEDRDHVTNVGEIAGRISLNGNDDTLINQGTIIGSVDLGAGNDTFDGRGGTVNGTISGGSGDDSYIIDDPTALLLELSNGGTDGVQSLVTWRLGLNFESLTLLGSADINAFGNGISNFLVGNIGNNTLDGQEGADVMAGGNGNDIYWVDDAGDTVTEAPSGGIDGIVTTISYTLPSEVENIQLIGGANINATGNGLANRLIGNDGNNVLDGLGGPDMMTGLAGDDIYYVDSIGDTVIEAVGGGTDAVVSSISYVLLDNLENLVLGGSDNINGTGNAVDNALTGNSGNNRLDGRAGADNMLGLGGNDVYIVDNAGDLVTEGSAAGTDGVVSSVDFTLGANVENLTLVGSAVIGVGNGLTNRITGNAENNVINGGLAYDVLIGGLGNDIFVMNTAITGPSNIDYLADFNDLGSDQIRLENAIFAALTVGGVLAANLFKDIGTGAQDSDDVILYNSTTGALLYDSNGLAAGGVSQFAVVDVGTSIAASDFFVI